jgi:multiple sugar transport system substrate-binding protein
MIKQPVILSEAKDLLHRRDRRDRFFVAPLLRMTGRLRISFILIAAAFLLPGCAREQTGGSVPDPNFELTYWPAPNTQEIELAETLVTAWNQLHPDIHVRMQPIPVSQSTEEVLLAAIAGKTTPDVCSNIWPGALHDYMQSGGLVALDRFPDFDSVALSRTPRELLETFRASDSHLYQLPWKTNPVMMFYNERLFREAGVDSIPRTYSQYLAAAKKVTRDLDGDGQIDVWMGERDIRPIWWQRLFDFYPFFIGASGGSMLFRNNEVAFDNREAVEVFSFFRECYGSRYFPRTFFQGGDPFNLEKKATHFAGPWQVSQVQKFAPHIKFGVAPLPVPDSHTGPVYTSGDYKNIAIFSTTRHPKEAWEFVKFLVSPQHDLLLLKIANQIPVRGDLLTNPIFSSYFEKNPVMVSFARQAPYTRGMDAVPDLQEIFDAISQEYEACCVYGRVSPADAIRDAAKRTRLIVEWNQ